MEASSAMMELLDKQASLDPSQRIEAYAEQVKASLGTAGKVAKTMADNMKVISRILTRRGRSRY